MRLYLSLLLVVLMYGFARSQPATDPDPGVIKTPAILPNPMDPNGDGWITSTGGAFTGPLDETEFELPYIPIPTYEAEPVPDNQVFSSTCTMYELVGDAANGAESTYYYWQDLDGLPDNGDEWLFFRFRVAKLQTTVGLSILIDTDQKFGISADPNAVVGNPGFELEISVNTSSSGQVGVYNVDGVSSSGVLMSSYAVSTNMQIAYALNQDSDCSSKSVPGFIDIHLPFAALNLPSTTPIRMAGAAREGTGTNLGGNADDIAGVDGNTIPSDDDQFIAVVGSYPPFAFQDDGNGAPSCVDGTQSLDENASNGTAVYVVSTFDPDGDALTYAITAGNTGTAFAINSSGQITVSNTSALDFETTPSFTLTVNVSDGTLSDDAVITINLTDINEAPTVTDATVSLNENSPNSTAVHTVLASDPDGDALSYTISAGNTGTAFTINATGEISVSDASALDFETTPPFTLTVTVSDGTLSDKAVITISLIDINEAPAANDATVSIDENSVNGTTVHTISAADPDGDPLFYSITGGNTGDAFAVNSSGMITVSNATALDFETTPSFSLTVTVYDGTLSDNAIIKINLNDVNESPKNVNQAPVASDVTISIDENSVNGTTVHSINGSDPDGDALAYGITTGNADNAFAISDDGVISVNDYTKLDFEITPAFYLTIQIGDGERYTQVIVTIELRDLNEAPGISDATITIAENLPPGSVVYQFVSNDPDANDAPTFSIEAGNSSAAFAINASTGEVTVDNIDALQQLENPAFILTVMVTDAGGLTATANLTIVLEKVETRSVIDPLKGFSPNGDGENDFWLIKGIEAFPDNEVKVFNRWGILVYGTRNYDNINNVWRGVDNVSLPEMTYFFVITVKGLQPITGYVIMKQ